jgi:thioredoxin-related protein
MRRLIFLSALTIIMTLTLALSAFAQSTAYSNGIKWHSNIYEAYQKALKENKPLVVYFYFKGCGNCHKLENESFSSSEMGALADKAVFARVDIETDDSYKNISKLRDSLKLERYPVIAVLDVATDKIVERGRILGYFSNSEFYFHLSQVLLSSRQQL